MIDSKDIKRLPKTKPKNYYLDDKCKNIVKQLHNKHIEYIIWICEDFCNINILYKSQNGYICIDIREKKYNNKHFHIIDDCIYPPNPSYNCNCNYYIGQSLIHTYIS